MPSKRDGSSEEPAEVATDVATDIVAYLIMEMPNWEAVGEVVPTLAELASSGVVRILDLLVVERDASGAVSVYEPDAVASLANLGAIEGAVRGLLSDGDVELASLALRLGTVGVIAVTEDRWASPLAAAVRDAGGHIVAGERVPASRVEDALAGPATQNAQEAEQRPEES